MESFQLIKYDEMTISENISSNNATVNIKRYDKKTKQTMKKTQAAKVGDEENLFKSKWLSTPIKHIDSTTNAEPTHLSKGRQSKTVKNEEIIVKYSLAKKNPYRKSNEKDGEEYSTQNKSYIP